MRNNYRDLANALAIGTWQYTNDSPPTVEASREAAQMACLIDCMISLRKIAGVLTCHSTFEIPKHLKAIEHLAREFWVKPNKKKKAIQVKR